MWIEYTWTKKMFFLNNAPYTKRKKKRDKKEIRMKIIKSGK